MIERSFTAEADEYKRAIILFEITGANTYIWVLVFRAMPS